MGTLYLVASTFTFAKTVRDEFEGQKLINKLAEARAEASEGIRARVSYRVTRKRRRAVVKIARRRPQLIGRVPRWHY